MDIVVIGAGGDIGRQIAFELLTRRIVEPSARLQLVGRRGGASERILPGLRSDLIDAFAERAPIIDVALDPDEIVGDIIVMAAGQTLPTDPRTELTRDRLAAVNAPVFREYANAIATHGTGDEVVIVVSNPTELAVEIFGQALGRRRVLGIGAHSDSLRFEREIAADLGIRRHLVKALVLGEHGAGAIPLWSSVRVRGLDPEERDNAISRIRGDRRVADFPRELQSASARLSATLRDGTASDAFDEVNAMPADLRTLLRPFAAHLTGAKTAVATSHVAASLIQTVMEGREVLLAANVMTAGEFMGLHAPIGMPVVVSDSGWERVIVPEMWREETEMLRQAATRIQAKVEEWLER